MKISDMKLFTNTGLLHSKSNYEILLNNFKPEHYKGITAQQIQAEYNLICQEIKQRRI
jgi:hypothetical protein